jgi:hypothetical protein
LGTFSWFANSSIVTRSPSINLLLVLGEKKSRKNPCGGHFGLLAIRQLSLAGEFAGLLNVEKILLFS